MDQVEKTKVREGGYDVSAGQMKTCRTNNAMGMEAKRCKQSGIDPEGEGVCLYIYTGCYARASDLTPAQRTLYVFACRQSQLVPPRGARHAGAPSDLVEETIASHHPLIRFEWSWGRKGGEGGGGLVAGDQAS